MIEAAGFIKAGIDRKKLVTLPHQDGANSDPKYPSVPVTSIFIDEGKYSISTHSSNHAFSVGRISRSVPRRARKGRTAGNHFGDIGGLNHRSGS